MSTIGFTFSEETHTYLHEDGRVIPSTTQVIKDAGLISWAGIPAMVLERKRQLGTLVHQVTQLLDQGENLEDYAIPQEVVPYLNGYINFKNDTGFVPEIIECRMIADLRGMLYGMTPDRTGALDGVPHVIELKCGASEHPAWGVQLASYDLGLPKISYGRRARAAIQLGPDFPRNYKIHDYHDAADYTVWLNSLANMIWKINKKLYAAENVPERLVA